MKNQFSWLAFLRKIPLDLLQPYLLAMGVCEQGYGASIPWDILAYDHDNYTRGMAYIRQAILEAGTAIRERVVQDFMDINDMADDYGITVLLNSGRYHPQPVDLQEHLARYAGSHAKAFFVRYEWPEIFQAALRYRRVDAIAEHRWYKTGRIEEAILDVSPGAQAHLAEVISHQYRLRGRGHGCVVDVEPRGEDIYIFVYPEDYARRRLAFNERHELIVETARPAFEVIFVWQTRSRTVEYFSPGTKSERQQLVKAFGRVMLGVELCPEDRRQAIYQLDPLKYRGFPFALRPEDRVLAVMLKEIWMRNPDNPDHCTMHYSSELRVNPDSCYNTIDDGINRERLSLEALEVTRVQLRMLFRGKMATDRPISRTITIAHPDMCSLKRTDPYYLKVLDLLERWGIDVAPTITEPVYRVGLV